MELPDPWIKHEISPRSYGHGIGAGDVNGDGRTDIITPKGWFEAPPDPRRGKWTFHEEFDLGATGFIYVTDVNNDGVPDLITSLGHDYGIFWMEQKREVAGKRTWVKHLIDNAWSQSHAMTLADLNGDGRPELITGKRYYAHEHDPGANEPLGVYWYEALDRQASGEGTSLTTARAPEVAYRFLSLISMATVTSILSLQVSPVSTFSKI